MKTHLPNPTNPTPKKDWRDRFLVALVQTGIVSTAAKVAGVNRQHTYSVRHQDPEFAKRWDDAIEQATELLEAEAIRRAVQGTLKPVFHGGKKVGAIREYSDVLLIFLLKARKPHIYRDNQSTPPSVGVGGTGGTPQDTLAILGRLAALLASDMPTTVENR